jgi:hypothetical protein
METIPIIGRDNMTLFCCIETVERSPINGGVGSTGDFPLLLLFSSPAPSDLVTCKVFNNQGREVHWKGKHIG